MPRVPFSPAAATLLLLFLLVSRPWLEAGMLWHMGLQLPLLVLLGVLAVDSVSQSPLIGALTRRYRAALLLLALVTFGLWMLPRLLDAALHQPQVEIAKWLSLPVAGAALRLGWPQLPSVLHGVLHLEFIATLLRLGWLYLQAPERYCVSYGIADQQSLGFLLLVYAGVYGLLLGVRVLLIPSKQPASFTS